MKASLMKFLAVLAAMLALAPSAAAQQQPAQPQYQSVEALKSLGVRNCLGAVTNMTKWLYDTDDFAYLNTWHKDAADKHMSLTMTSKAYSDGTSIAAIAVAPTPAGTCDTTFSQLFVVKESCAKTRDTTFKEWKYYADLSGTPMYEDPTSESVVVALASVPNGCLIVKTGMLFFPAADKAK